MTKLVQPLKWHGGKCYLADWIISLMPPRCKKPNAPAPDDTGWLHYVEPFAGGLAVLLANDPEGISEVVNDKNRDLLNFWQVMQDGPMFDQFKRLVEAKPFAQEAWQQATAHLNNWASEIIKDCVYHAAQFFIACRQSLAGRMKGFTGITKTRTRRGMNEQVSAWLNAIEGLPAVHERLKRVLILNDDALAVIRSQDGPRTLFYLDPPYLHETRASTGEYEHEMSEGDHEKLLVTLSGIDGRFLLSGYHSELYDDAAKHYGWRCHERQIDNKAAGGKTKRVMTECVWCNY